MIIFINKLNLISNPILLKLKISRICIDYKRGYMEMEE